MVYGNERNGCTETAGDSPVVQHHPTARSTQSLARYRRRPLFFLLLDTDSIISKVRAVTNPGAVHLHAKARLVHGFRAGAWGWDPATCDSDPSIAEELAVGRPSSLSRWEAMPTAS